ncbi:MAG: phenylalanine--tRNA ligase subunit alpha [Clostridia bacterium]|nr:phenylalanine--tRNA ligase subunit alpha [Clostridia bacterium]
MKEKISAIRAAVEEKLTTATTMEQLEELRVAYLGKKGELTSLLRGMGALSAEERPIMGQLVNEVRALLESEIQTRSEQLKKEQMQAQLQNEKIDVTMPGTRQAVGNRHPLTIALDEIKDLFISMGFSIAEGPEIETDYYNFEALNLPPNHPARDTQDTFYITENILLRTQTSPMQVRVMEKQEPPIRVIAPGRVFRADEVDATHSPVFHQIEGLVVDKGITMGDLKGTLDIFAKKMFGPDCKTRFRPHHFPFTEPSAEMDVSCFSCGGKGCRVCKDEGWIEVLGCGMVHPKVLQNCNIDPEVYSGFAFGMGLERIVMTRYGVSDLRLFFENDIRFLNQFKGVEK